MEFVALVAKITLVSKCLIKNLRTNLKNSLVHTSKKFRGHHKFHMDAVSMGLLASNSRLKMTEMQIHETSLLNSGRIILPYGSASYGHFRNMKVYGETDLVEVINLANKALEIALATRAFKDRYVLLTLL